MIVSMKKVHILTQAKNIPFVIEKLRMLGVLHLEHLSEPKGERLGAVKDQILAFEKVILLLQSCAQDGTVSMNSDNSSTIVSQVLKLQAEMTRLEDCCQRRANDLARWLVWGDFDPADILFLRAQGLAVALFDGTPAEFRALPQDVFTGVVGRTRSRIRALVAARGILSAGGLTQELPAESLSVMQAAQAADGHALKNLKVALARYSAYLPQLRLSLLELTHDLKFEEAAQGVMKDGPLAVLKGFCPADALGKLEAEAGAAGWGVLAEEPAPDDRVPTLLRNPAWVATIKPLFDFMTIIPGYREADVSACFLLFFSLFFGILIGDAGYGAVFMLVTLGLQRRAPKGANAAPFQLMYVLSACAIAWGLATGTFFGVSLFGQWIKPLVPWLTEDRNVQLLCFMIGVVHLTVAHVWRAVCKMPALSAFSEAGWILLLWSSYFFCGQIILDRPLPYFVMPMLWVGMGIVVLFNRPHPNVFKAVGMGLGDLLLGIMGVFIDLISYIRLFAVGTASLALAESFNAAVTSLGFNNVLAGFGTALILVLGHSLNIVLSLMAVLVHGLRLNILEFSVHQGIEWTGFKYRPFSKA